MKNIGKIPLASKAGRLALVIIPLTLFVLSCTEPIDFSGKETDPYAVLQCTAKTDSTLNVRMTWSRFFLSNNVRPFTTIDDADLRITSNGVPLVLAGVDSGNYRFNYVVREGDTLEVRAAVPGYNKGVLNATTIVPARPALQVLEVKVDSSEGEYYSRKYIYSIKVKLEDPKEENYYAMSIDYARRSDTMYGTDVGWVKGKISCKDPLLLDPSLNVGNIVDDGGLSDNAEREFRFSDDKINGKSHVFTVQLSDEYYYSVDEQDDNIGKDIIDKIFQMRLTIVSISPELHRFMMSRDAANDAEGSFFSEPVQVICNVQNGIGCFGAQTSKSIVFPVQ
ncbi:MAG: DUF4249 domain-containing protein [Bacteroidales bacterium]|nr:DUF4249 domain-containing protein [Bacteroidales bacterium]